MLNIKKLKTFVSDLDGNKFTVSKFSPNQPPAKIENTNASWLKTPKVEESKPELDTKKSSSSASYDPDLK